MAWLHLLRLCELRFSLHFSPRNGRSPEDVILQLIRSKTFKQFLKTDDIITHFSQRCSTITFQFNNLGNGYSVQSGSILSVFFNEFLSEFQIACTDYNVVFSSAYNLYF